MIFLEYHNIAVVSYRDHRLWIRVEEIRAARAVHGQTRYLAHAKQRLDIAEQRAARRVARRIRKRFDKRCE